MGVGWVLEAVAACAALPQSGRNSRGLGFEELGGGGGEEEERKEEEEWEKKEEEKVKEEKEAAEPVVGDRIPPTGEGRSSNPSSSFNICLSTKEIQTRNECLTTHRVLRHSHRVLQHTQGRIKIETISKEMPLHYSSSVVSKLLQRYVSFGKI